jgi:hypothetical protein
MENMESLHLLVLWLLSEHAKNQITNHRLEPQSKKNGVLFNFIPFEFEREEKRISKKWNVECRIHAPSVSVVDRWRRTSLFLMAWHEF